jgi:hypothetical protein
MDTKDFELYCVVADPAIFTDNVIHILNWSFNDDDKGLFAASLETGILPRWMLKRDRLTVVCDRVIAEEAVALMAHVFPQPVLH